MPIRINLLAEAQAAEEARRRDPVKLSAWIGGFLICLVVLWGVKLQFDIIFIKKSVKDAKTTWTSLQKQYNLTQTNKLLKAQVEKQLVSLDRLSTNRFLWGTVLNALQQTTVDDVVLRGFKGAVTFRLIPEVLPKRDGNNEIPGVPPDAIQTIALTVDGRDFGRPEDLTYSKYKDSLNRFPYFQALISRYGGEGFSLGGSVGKATPDLSDASKQFVDFSLSYKLEVHRHE